ncbi:MAG: pseudouridine synthase [Oscillospiraceae bacterium]
MPLMRLDKFFASQEILTRKEIRPLLKKGNIKINGVLAKAPDQKIDTENDVIMLFNQIISYQPYVYLMLNKPQGYVSSTNDKINKTVLDLVPNELFRSGLFPAGRLDKDSTGFVLLTNDGDFSHRILSPKNHVPKIYIVRIDNEISDENIKNIESGVTLADGYQCRPCEIEMLENSENPLLKVILHEGKYHEIKRMFGVYDCGVLSLKRIQIGGLKLDENLPEGSVKVILHNDVESILFNF